MTRQDDLNILLKDLLMLRGELETMDVAPGGWEAALKQRHLRQQRHDLEDALQERMAELGSMVLDALMEQREDALLSIARGPLGLAAPLPKDDLIDDPGDDEGGPAGGPDEGPPPSEPDEPPAAASVEVPPEPEATVEVVKAKLKARAVEASPEPKPKRAAAPAPKLESSPSFEPAKVLYKPVSEQDPAKQIMDAWMSRRMAAEEPDTLSVGFEFSHQQEFLQRAWEQAGPTPMSFNSKDNARAELSRLQSLVNQELAQWSFLDQTTHFELCSWTTARMRSLDDVFNKRFPKRKANRAALQELFPRMNRHIRAIQLAYVHGLSLAHQPRHGASWIDDARFFERSLLQRLGLFPALKAELKSSGAKAACMDDFNLDDALRCLTERVREGIDADSFLAALHKLLKHKVAIHQETRVVNLAVEFSEVLEGDKALKPLRREVKKKIEAASREAEASQQPALPVDWPWLEHTLGKRCALIGGDPRQHRIQAIQDAFGFDELQWCESGPRHVQSLIERVRSGSLDMVIILRCFCAHRISIPLFKLRKSGAAPDFKLVQADAYGIQQLRAGVERFMQEAEA